ncbi:hypothetical protein B0T25DRAFT_562796 [Lasiosphaeria hispida]|uniref:Uncharacterized protein n=1 Tax=Lasiosphaeria hispida TaxID=260671 RepID=A0AAJ0MKH4_9PEZI|nr:hypothetical protein B0T25DRAFT_562796 [Lasiosphaeria hispida]
MSSNSNLGNPGAQKPVTRQQHGLRRAKPIPTLQQTPRIRNQLQTASQLQRGRLNPPEDQEVTLQKQDPTLPAKMHGSEPSRGAKIDAKIQAEEQEMLRKKDNKNA